MRQILLVFIFISLFSCRNKEQLSQQFSCDVSSFKNLEEIRDVKNLFSVQFPEHWKTNLFYDEVQSSIYTADTTKQLTETTILDITYVSRSISFDTDFTLKHEQEMLSKKLIRIASEEIKLSGKPTYYSISRGLKAAFPYQACHVFMKVNAKNFIHAKVEIYGDSLVEERLCKAVNLIERVTY